MKFLDFVEENNIPFDKEKLYMEEYTTGVTLENLDGIEDFTNLKELEVEDCGLKGIGKLPETLVFLNIKSNRISEIEELPKGLKILMANDNCIENIELPDSLECLEVRYNLIKSISFPNSLKQLCIADNPLEEVKEFPEEIVLTPIKFVYEMFENTPIGDRYNNDWKTIQLVVNNLNGESAKRGAASIADTGLFDFKIRLT